MAAIPKPHRIAVLVPQVTIDGTDAAYDREAALLMWTACIEICQRHPRISVLDADTTPLFPQEGHFAPQHAGRGGRPTDAFYAPMRRDEVIWLELALGAKPGAVRLHVIGRDGTQESFDALGRNLGDQIQQVLASWFTARGLGASPKRFESVTAEDVLAVVRVIAPTLVEQASAWALPVATRPTWSLAVVEAEDEEAAETQAISTGDVLDEAAEDSAPLEVTIDSTLDGPPIGEEGERRRTSVKPLVQRLPPVFRLPALRLLELALREDLAEAVLAAEPDHPQALFARYEKTAPYSKDVALLRQVIASAPGWATPYEELQLDPDASGDALDALSAPTLLEAVAAAGVAAVCRPAGLHTLESAAGRLAANGRVDEGLRLVERAVELQPEDPRAHLALLHLHEQTDREGARLDQALRSASLHGCPMDPVLPWYPDQIHVDLRASSALLEAGRLDEAIALRTSRLEGRDVAWPNHSRLLASWRRDPQFVAWCYAREGWFRGDEARAVEGFGRVEPTDSTDLAIFLDSLVALGREHEAPLAWAQFGLGGGADGAVARLAAARALMAAGEWRSGIEELWRVELAHPGRDEHVALARCGLAMSAAPIEIIEAALGEWIAAGATTLAARMARDVADFVPAAGSSALVARALGRATPIEFDPSWLDGFGPETRSRRAIDALFVELGPLRKGGADLARGDRLVDRWLEVAFTETSEEDRAGLAQAAAYIAAQALARYFAATTAAPTTIAGALRTVASEALALVRRHRSALSDRDARAVLAAIDPILRRVDRWVGSMWLGAVERSLGIDERSTGDLAGFLRDLPTVAARILGPEEAAMLSWSIARLHRDRPDGWAAKVVAQASRLASHTGRAGVDEWADAVVAQLGSRELELEVAIDELHTACYLADGISAVPCVHAARVLFDAGRASAALGMLSSGLRAATPEWRDRQLRMLADPWRRANLDVPLEPERALAGVIESLQRLDPARAEKLARWTVAYDPRNDDAHRNLGLALAQQGKTIEAMHHLVRGTREQAAQIVSGVLVQAGKQLEAIAVLEYASRWYARADQWLAYGGIANAAGDHGRAAKAYHLAHQLDPSAPGVFDASQLEALTRSVAAAPIERDPIYAQLEAGDHAGASARLGDPSWRIRRAALHATRFRVAAENHVEVAPRARAAAIAIMTDAAGSTDREAHLARNLALQIREQAYFARDPVPRLGDRMTREIFYQEFRRRGGVVLEGDVGPAAAAFIDRVVIAGGKVSRTSDYVALLRDLASLAPREALAQFDLDDAGYLEVARAWAAAMDADPTIARTITAGLAKR